jgi:YD repeat-containing protein
MHLVATSLLALWVFAAQCPAAFTCLSTTVDSSLLKIREPSGDTATFTYNGTSGRLESVAYSGGAAVNYTSYDNNGNLLALNENGSNAITRAYDALTTGANGGSGEIPRTRDPKGKTSGSERVNCYRVQTYTERGQTLGYRYYPNGKLAKLIYPGGSETGTGHVEYLYNAEGRLWQVRDKLDSTSNPRVTTYAWNNDGRLQSVSRPNNTIRTIGYDNAGRPETISETAGATALLSIGLQYYPSDGLNSTRQPIALAVPTYFRMKHIQLLGYEGSLVAQAALGTAPALGHLRGRRCTVQPDAGSEPSPPTFLQHPNGMPVTDRCPGQPGPRLPGAWCWREHRPRIR